ncbi:RCC1 domain-containing protein [Vibrio aquimaris]|uniref:Regulator of chromosome condensation (RCC1) repeat protein n=1 Tax=Vibrio aquimaris TaxID=2587862 RepID=A0A5P9CLB4_9VIBR|nr:hypothetical protein [Vibrio aquimaris]QFT27078.1 Regulator of chromosome condensation (RCC1) repeat protein [Vibrio aquimaris]
MIKMKVFSFVTLFFFISTVQAQTPTSWKHVSLGSSHTCALSTSNELYCWGNNYSGQLGVGLSDVHRVTRPSMVSLSEDTKQLSLAGTHSCALSIQGNIACWGDNMRYLLGPGSYRRFAPRPLPAQTPAMSLSMGSSHACLVKDNNTAQCWGDNFFGQLGTGRTRRELTPTNVVEPSPLSDIQVGENFTCLQTQSGQVKCWGNNYFGQLGIGFPTNQSKDNQSYMLPQLVELGRVSSEIATGEHFACSLLDNKQVKCWGNNQSGQLGIGSQTNKAQPTSLTFSENVQKLALGKQHACAILQNGTLQCWGDNQYGQLGIGSRDSQTTPTTVALGQSAKQISLGDKHTCALLADDSLKCWGDNIQGQLGLGHRVLKTTPQSIN